LDLVCLETPGYRALETQDNLNVIRLPLSKTRRNALTYIWEYSSFVISAFFITTWLYIRRRYRLVHVYNQPDFLVFAALLPKLFGAKILIDYRDAMPEGTMDKFGLSEHHPVVRFLRLIEQCSMNFSNRILTVHKPFKNLLVSRGWKADTIEVFMNLPDPDLFNRDRYPIHEKSGRNELRLMHHGTLNEVYNVGLVLEALALLKSSSVTIPVSFSIYGTGPDLPRLEKMVKTLGLDNVYFKGRVPLDIIPEQIAYQADVGIVPTRGGPVGDYSLSNKLLEYVVMGKPVIASRLRTFQDVFSDNSILFFDSSSPEELAKCVLQIANNQQLCLSMVQSADADLAKYSWENNKKRYLEFIADTIGL
jgi:glycosyltransferase involved in cell wall biosynthesis